MLEIITLVLICCNGDGSKKGVINGFCIVGIILSVILAFFYSALCLIDTLLYVIFMIIGNAQGRKENDK